jgi:transcriptional regulator with XRE-family HTH domain
MVAQMTTDTTATTNFDFAAKVGCHHTMASRLRNGERSPSIQMFILVARAFNLDCQARSDWLDAIAQGSVESGRWLRENVFVPAAHADAAPVPANG